MLSLTQYFSSRSLTFPALPLMRPATSAGALSRAPSTLDSAGPPWLPKYRCNAACSGAMEPSRAVAIHHRMLRPARDSAASGSDP